MQSEKEKQREIQELIARLNKKFPEEKSGLRHQAYLLKLRQMAEEEMRKRIVADAEQKKAETRERNGTANKRYDSNDGTGSFADRVHTPIPENFERPLVFDPEFQRKMGTPGLNPSDRRPGHDSRPRPKRKRT